MRTIALLAVLAAFPLSTWARPVAPNPAAPTDDASFSSRPSGLAPGEEAALPYIQCVPYAREVSGIQIRGDAHTWWDQAAGRYARGNRPRVGAVMSFPPYGAMRLGHVAAVSKVIDNRTVLLRHANWSPIDGRRGNLEDNVRAVDVSPAGDWSEVRVWFAPLGGLGTTHWPVNGFIYNQKPKANERLTVLASAAGTNADRLAFTSRIGADFLRGIAPEGKAAARKTVARERFASALPSLKSDPIGRLIASRMR
jgi:surface antigen